MRRFSCILLGGLAFGAIGFTLGYFAHGTAFRTALSASSGCLGGALGGHVLCGVVADARRQRRAART